jgi:signal transduction histidine kinase
VRSIRVRLSMVFALLLLLVIGLGGFSIQRLGDVNQASDEIRNHWLQDARILGDLANYMSDYRAAEASDLLSATPAELAASSHEIDSLRETVAGHQRAYMALAQEPAEAALYAEFARQWGDYQGIAADVLALSRAGRRADALALFHGGSRRAFDLASDTLAQLTVQTVDKARIASTRAASTYDHARRLIVIAMLTASLLLIGVITYITRSILTPMLDLAARMRALAGHHTDIDIPGAARADEVGEMARSATVFRDNARALVRSQQRLLEQAATLDEALENEQRLTAKQRNFVSMTSHEFRTPLTVIDGHAQRLIKMSGRLDPAAIAERAGRIRSAVMRMTGIMDSLLAASRVLDGEGVFNPTGADPGALLHEACQAHREATRRANILEDYAGLPPVIPGDPKLLFHAFSNLVSNALKYSVPGTPVEVTARVDDGHVVVRVRDHGIGIPARDRARLFERYFRGGNATGIAGTGVGLHLVAMVMGLHRGEVYAESLEGVGSTFVLRLPAASAAPAGQQATALETA